MLIFAHRGASGYAPENTIKAMLKAVDLGCEAVELDVHMADGELWVFHDRHLDLKSNGEGLLHQKTSHYLRQIQVSGEPISTLTEVLLALNAKVTVNIELKGAECSGTFIKQYYNYVNKLGYHPSQLLISSFNHIDLLKIRQHLPMAYIAPLYSGVPLSFLETITKLNAYSIHLDINFICKKMVEQAHDLGLKVYVYTVDNKDDIRDLLLLGVDGIFSNFPDKAKYYVAEATARL